MNEVSSKVFHIFFKPAAAKGMTPAKMVEGTPVTVETLKSKNGRIDWSDLCQIHRNLRTVFTDEELTEVGRSYFRSPALRFVFVIARLRFTPMGFFRWLSKPRQGAGNQMFTCVVPNHRDISESECELELTLAEGYEVCWDFFLTSKGNMEEMPTLLGHPQASVTLERIPRGGRYRIKIPKRAAFFTRLFRVFTWPFTVRAAARELQDAHETLRDRYAEIDAANTALDRQRALLDTAYRFGQQIYGERDPSLTAEAIANALVDIAGFAGAMVEASPKDLPDRVERAFSGTRGEVGEAKVIELTGRLAGSIRLQVREGDDQGEAQTLIDLLAPTIALALDNAFGYRALSDYQKNLEKIVEDRTTELRSTSAELAGTVAQLTEAQGARERFFGNISHEIRTPLSIVLLAVSDIEKRSQDKLEPRARAALGSITDSARKLVRLVDELLLLAAGQEGKLRIKAEPTNLSAMIGMLVSAWTPATESAGLSLVARVPEQLFANVDPVAIERVATNLVSNAVKYTPAPGSVEIEVAVETEHLRLSVFDSGDGISDELATRLFGRFERAEQTGNIGGSGIGLAIVKQLVEGHGGTVGTHRREGRGTELRVLLPAAVVLHGPVANAATPVVSDAPIAAKPAVQLAAPDSLARGSILLAEDDVRLAEMIGALLGDDYVVRIANDGATALEIARRYQPQLLITDVDMPGMDGIELSKRFREVTNDRLAPVIILSAVLDLGTRVAGLEAGAVDYVTKPFDPTELRARVRAQFRMRDLAMRLHRAEQLSTLGVLTSGLAHELRNPANGVVNAVEPLRQLLPPELLEGDQPVGQLLDVIGECAEQINTLARQLLGFRNSATELQTRPTKLHELVQRALSIGQDTYKDVVIRVRVPDDVTVDCAPPLLIQVLTNLLENAAHAAGRGGWIELIARSDGAQVSLEIADSGPGVPVELRNKIFEPFFTTKKQGIGTGLGLAVSREIVSRHRGTLEVEDQGAHSVFVVRIPRRAA